MTASRDAAGRPAGTGRPDGGADSESTNSDDTRSVICSPCFRVATSRHGVDVPHVAQFSYRHQGTRACKPLERVEAGRIVTTKLYDQRCLDLVTTANGGHLDPCQAPVGDPRWSP